MSHATVHDMTLLDHEAAKGCHKHLSRSETPLNLVMICGEPCLGKLLDEGRGQIEVIADTTILLTSSNAKGGKFMSIEDSHQGALVRKVDVEVLWEPGNFQDDGAKRVGVCFASNTNLELWTEEVEQGVIDNMIIFQKPFPGAARTELESQL